MTDTKDAKDHKDNDPKTTVDTSKEARREGDDRRQFDSQAEIERVKAEVMAAPAPGTDPDARRRVAKTLESMGIDQPDGYSVDPITGDERQKWQDDVDKGREQARADGEQVAAKDKAAEKRGAASDSDSNPRGRTATNPRQQKAAEEK